MSDPGATSQPQLLEAGLENLKRKFSFLSEYSDEFIKSTGVDVLIKAETASRKLIKMDKDRKKILDRRAKGRAAATGKDKGKYTEETAAAIDDEVSELVAEAYRRATTVLSANRLVLDEIAELLVEKETVDAEELQELLINRDVKVAEYV